MNKFSRKYPDSLKSVIIAKRWEHHSKSGGYDRLASEMESDSVVIHSEKYSSVSAGFQKQVCRLFMPSSKYANHYGLSDFFTEWKAYRTVRKYHAGVLHALYAEDQLHMLLKQRHRIAAAITGTFHLAEESGFVTRLERDGLMKRYSPLDSAIVVARSMVPYFEKIVGEGRVYFVPHGIDVSAFKPADENGDAKKKSGPLKVLIVGGHGRDWKTFQEVVEAMTARNANIRFSAVVPQNVAGRLGSEVHTVSGIREEDLIARYREADLLYIPLSFATANNSLLESLACGTPVISTQTGGIPDYLDDSCGWMLPRGDVMAAVDLLGSLALNREMVKRKSSEAREKALQFRWENVTEQIREVHKFTHEIWKKSSDRY